MHADHDDQREFLRIDYETNLNYQEIKDQKLSHKKEILTRNISACGVLFRTTNMPPALSSIIRIELDPKMVNVCSELEEDLILHNGGVLGKVVRISEGEPGVSYDIGVCFLRKRDITDKELEEMLPE